VRLLLSRGECRDEDAVLLTVNEVPPVDVLVVFELAMAAVVVPLLLLYRLLEPVSSRRCDFSRDKGSASLGLFRSVSAVVDLVSLRLGGLEALDEEVACLLDELLE
jgi:hypothetical protein